MEEDVTSDCMLWVMSLLSGPFYKQLPMSTIAYTLHGKSDDKPLITSSLQGLLSTAAPGVDTQALLKADISAVPKTLPVLSLAFVFHNIIPVISTDLEVIKTCEVFDGRN